MNIVQLGKEDYRDTIDFLNMVFSMTDEPHDFPNLLPTYYKETQNHMNCHYAVKQEGKIKSLVGIYPCTMKIGESLLHVARIGAVSTHPYSQKQGLMRSLLSYCVNKVKQEYDLAVLGGLRHRYLHFGFEKCGTEYIYKINQHNLRYYQPSAPLSSTIYVEKYKEVTAALLTLHNSSHLHVQRDLTNFFDICRSWNHKPYIFYDKNEVCGYLVADKNMTHIYEFNVKEDYEGDIIYSFMNQYQLEEVSIHINPFNSQVTKLLTTIAEDVQIENTANWQLFQWEKVLQALLTAKLSKHRLLEGEIVLHIHNYNTIKIIVKNQTASCHQTDEKPNISLDSATAMKVLFGPTSPDSIIEIPCHITHCLQSWCPLPLYMGTQDFA
ncbi:GNAT family N-acetyltransferase [Bacillus sp. HMF5848]|uniref:GNAT family N-acetyltransferase n=1 Tax=Bacillus sp. HMF5848 TaxID=2495421 RepID=UPI000F76DD32|nr:GNAT family N-acetyltransferase [Bacillus sp. HMF5848]RSK26648.1 GNAT family N-acetyltransferase [Bacillus sp. HMF5848]